MTQNNHEIVIPTAILEVSAIDLTLAGQIELMQFSHEAINFANKRMLKTQQKDNPFAYFLKLCNIWHQDHNVDTAPQIVEAMQQKYGITKSELKLNSNGKNPDRGLEIPTKSEFGSSIGKAEFTRKQVVMHHENKHTDEEYRKIREYHQKLRPHEYVTTSDGDIEKKQPRITLEEELSLHLERRLVIIDKLTEDWSSCNGEAFRRTVGDKTAMALYSRLIVQLQTGEIWPGPISS